MPTYSYFCEKCGNQDIHQSMMDDPLTICPKCSRIGLKKVYGAIGISFKGSGFYSTDSRKSKDSNGSQGS